MNDEVLPYRTSLKCILILSSQLCVVLPNGLSSFSFSDYQAAPIE